MRNILAIVERELRAYFTSPIAYVILTIFVFLSGLFFKSILAQVLQMGLMSQIQAQQLGPRLLNPAITQLAVLVSNAPVPQASG